MKQKEKTGQLITLQNKIEEQDDVIEKLKLQQNKLNNYINQFKEAMKRKTTSHKEGEKKNIVDTSKMTSQLNKEIENAKNMLKNYQHQLKNVQKNSTKVGTSDLSDLNIALRQKEIQLKNLKQSIKDLGFVKRKQQKLIEKKQKDEDGQKLTKLMDDLRKNKQLVEGLRKKKQSKVQALAKKKETIKDLEKEFQEKCRKNGEEFMRFEQFKERKKEKKRQDFAKSRPKRQILKKHQSVRQIINSQPIEKVEYTERYLRQIKTKREVAENSLKILEKKYEKKEDELNKNIETLRSENENLTARLLEKRKQKEMIENDGKTSSKTNRKLTPIKVNQ